MMRHLLLSLGLLGSSTGLALGCAAGADTNEECPIGSEKCACTEGGSCDGGLVCLSEICVDPDGGGSGPGSGAGGPGSGAGGPGSGGGPGTGGGFSTGGAGPECETGPCLLA